MIYCLSIQRMYLVVLAPLAFLPLGLVKSVSADVPPAPEVAFSFRGFDRTLHTVDEAETLSRLMESPSLPAEPSGFRDAVLYGQAWGRLSGDFACQLVQSWQDDWLAGWTQIAQSNSVFPSGAMLCGRSASFDWAGFANNVVNIRPLAADDRSHRANVRFGEENFLYVAAPQQAFARFAASSAKHISREESRFPDGARRLQLSADLSDSYHARLILIYPPDSSIPNHWCLVSRSLANQTTRVRSYSISPIPITGLQLPTSPENVPAIYVQVENTGAIPFFHGPLPVSEPLSLGLDGSAHKGHSNLKLYVMVAVVCAIAIVGRRWRSFVYSFQHGVRLISTKLSMVFHPALAFGLIYASTSAALAPPCYRLQFSSLCGSGATGPDLQCEDCAASCPSCSGPAWIIQAGRIAACGLAPEGIPGQSACNDSGTEVVAKKFEYWCEGPNNCYTLRGVTDVGEACPSAALSGGSCFGPAPL